VSSGARQRLLLETFATLADTLVADYDVVDMLQALIDTCRDTLDTSAAGILLAGSSGELEVIVSSNDSSELVEMLQASAEAGPCIECFRTGAVVSVADIADMPEEWSEFGRAALALGFRSVHAVPMRLRESTIGTLNLLREETGELDASDAVAAKALADVATIGILQERQLRERSILADQLQTALDRRIVIEQAKGVVAHTQGVPIDVAYELIRSYARSHQLPVSAVAARLVDLTLTLDDPA
jgi:transcriptional regulator with GAF, ATPase, and Fis domain